MTGKAVESWLTRRTCQACIGILVVTLVVSWGVRIHQERAASAAFRALSAPASGNEGALLAYILADNNDMVAHAPPTRTIEELDLRRGDRVADVGCGTGVYTFVMARMVTDAGCVWAVDIDPQEVHYVQSRARILGCRNVRTLVSRKTDACLAPASVNRILLCNVLHCFLNVANQDDEKTFQSVTRPFLSSLYRALEPGGRMLVVDFKPRPDGNGMREDAVVRALTRSGFRMVWSRAPGNTYDLVCGR